MANPFSNTCRALEGDSSHQALYAWVLASTILFAWLAWFGWVDVTIVEISESARFEVERAARPVAAPVGGKIVATFLTLDKKVEAGEVLMELDSRSEHLRLAEEQARLSTLAPQIEAIERQIEAREQAAQRSRTAAERGIEQARSRHREAVSEVAFANEKKQRMSQLARSGTLSEIEFLRVKSEADKQQAEAEALSSEIARLRASAQQNIHSDQAEIEELKREAAALKGQIEVSNAVSARLNENLEQYLIRAPVTGKVGSVAPFEAGAFVDVGGVIGSIVPDGVLKVVAEFAPAHVLGRVHTGQSARLRLDGFPWAQYGSIGLKVDRVATEIRDNRIRVEFIPDSLHQQSPFLQHGLPGKVEVAIEQTTPAILALRAAGQTLSKPVDSTPQFASASP